MTPLPKSQLLAVVQRLLRERPHREPFAGREDAFCRKLIQGHPNYPAKFSPGVRFFFAAKNLAGYNALYARLLDGREIDCSFRACVFSRLLSPRENVSRAFRFEVRVAKPTGYDAHHARRLFRDILFAFFISRREPPYFPEDVELREVKPTLWKIADPKLASEWQEFHADHAHLKIMPREEHHAEHRRKK